MKITPTLLSIPPYISTPWENVAALHAEGDTLFVDLIHGPRVEIPHLPAHVLESAFASHAAHLEQKRPSTPSQEFQAFTFPLPLNGEGLEQLGASLQHNPAQADMPDLPPDLLGKIGGIAKAIGIEDPALVPKAEPHCNCMHCQIARAIYGHLEQPSVEPQEEAVADNELSFRPPWDVTEIGDHLYLVKNPLDVGEEFRVYLGDPLGCTCGENNCEHIRAVLRS
jgi:hypothetical protein